MISQSFSPQLERELVNRAKKLVALASRDYPGWYTRPFQQICIGPVTISRSDGAWAIMIYWKPTNTVELVYLERAGGSCLNVLLQQPPVAARVEALSILRGYMVLDDLAAV